MSRSGKQEKAKIFAAVSITNLLELGSPQYLIIFNVFFPFADVEELSSRLMHTIIDIRNDENGRVVLAEASRDRIDNPLDLRCIYFEELISK